MNSKNLIGGLIISGLLASCGTPKDKNTTTEDISNDSLAQQKTKTELVDVFKKHHERNRETSDVMMFDIKAMMKSKDPAISDADGKNLLWMLGSLDVDSIIQNYNPQIASQQKAGYSWLGHDIRSLDTLYVPRIFPSMKKFFSADLNTFLENNPQVQDSVQDDQTVIIVTELPNGHFGLGYYEEGKLQLAYPVSIGDGRRHKDKKNHTRYQGRSPQGRFWIKRKHANKKSYAHDSMAYFLELIGERGLGLHGQKVQSKLQSHGCFRQPQLAAKMLFERVIADSTDGTPFVSYRQNHSIELDSAMYYTKIHPELKEEWLQRQDSLKKLSDDSIKEKKE